jgi:hypothetical protein
VGPTCMGIHTFKHVGSIRNSLIIACVSVGERHKIIYANEKSSTVCMQAGINNIC